MTPTPDPGRPLAVDVTIVYVNWNCAEEIQASIASVRERCVRCTYEIIVVDNDSPKGTGALAGDKELFLVSSGRNGGFGAGCNVGASRALGHYLLFLNPDTVLLNDVPGELMRFMESTPRAGIAGSLVEDGEGKVVFDGGRSLPSLPNEFLQHSTLCFRFPHGHMTSRPYLSDWDHLSTRKVGSVIGACMMMRRLDFERLGGFDESFFLYCEEVDLCRRVKQAGLSVWYVHTARILHKERQSTLQFYGSIHRVILQNLKSQKLYFLKHNGRVFTVFWRSMLAVVYGARYVLHRNPAHLEYIRWSVTG